MQTIVTEKNYKKLVLQVSLNGLSFAVIDLLSKKVEQLNTITFSNLNKTAKVEDLFEKVFEDYPVLNKNYDAIEVIHSNNLSTFVPDALFDEEYLGSYLQYNTKVFETDFFTFDSLIQFQMHCVYIPYVNMNNYFIDKFGSFDYKHASGILVSKILNLSKNNEDKKMAVHVADTHFEIIIYQNQKLLFYNTFEYKTAEDFLYYILFTAEQLQLNPENFILEFLGSISEYDPTYLLTFEYVRNVSFLEVNSQNLNITVPELRQHFILLNS
jgi:hypothetical protein